MGPDIHIRNRLPNDWGYVAVCHDCRHRHPVRKEQDMTASMLEWNDWLRRHPGHICELVTNQAWHDYTPNAAVTQVDNTISNPTITLAALASSSTLVAGAQSDIIAFGASATNQTDARVAANVQVNAAGLSAGVIEVWLYADFGGGVYPDTLTGAGHGAITVSSLAIKWSGLSLIGSVTTDTTGSRTYPFKPASVAQLCGGSVPPHYGMWVTHSTGAGLTGGTIFHQSNYNTVI